MWGGLSSQSLWVSPCSKFRLANLLNRYLLGFVLNFSKLKALTFAFCFKKFSGFYILFNLQFSRSWFTAAFQRRVIFYHIRLLLSTAFFFSLKLFFQSSSLFCSCSQAWDISYHILRPLSTTFLHLFDWPESLINLEKEAEKEGFEPSRRLPDLHP